MSVGFLGVIAMADETSRIKFKLGEHEFEFEGGREDAAEAYKAFLGAVQGLVAAAPVAPPAPPPTPAPPAPDNTGINVDVERVVKRERKELPPELLQDTPPLKRVFAEKDAVISLLALPKTDNAESDALLLLLYGYQELKNSEYPVTGVRLMQAAKQSGLHQVDRIDRKIAANAQYVLAAGNRRGRRYQLNNQGIAKAKEMINAIFN